MHRILYFILGCAFTCLAVGALLLWDSYQEFRTEKKLKTGIKYLFNSTENVVLTHDELVGDWEGRRSWGITYTISRISDGTFSEITNLQKSDSFNVASSSPLITSTGRWTFTDGKYAFYYVQSSDPDFTTLGPWVYQLSAESTKSFSYFIEEGNYGSESKK